MWLLFVIFHLLWFYIVNAVPVGNLSSTTSADTVGFVPENGGRNTLSILFSCLLTLGLCVYSAVHLNIPPKGESAWRSRYREFRWCIIGLFGPELIVYAAWRQWSSAWELKYQLMLAGDAAASCQTRGSQADQDLQPDYTILHGYYATMGGFAFDRNSVPEDMAQGLFGEHQRLTLTARGTALLARCGHLPHISESDIRDRNKADTLAKTLVCLQAGWMVIQVISRLSSNLPLTLLEVNTVGHIACALAMYLLWWNKPRMVREPTMLEGEWISPVAAYMFMASTISGSISGHKHARLSFHHSCPDDAELGTFFYRPASHLSDDNEMIDLGAVATSGQFFKANSTAECQITEIRHVLAAKAVSEYVAINQNMKCKDHDESQCKVCEYFKLPMDELLVPFASNWPNGELLRRVDSLTMGAILWSATIVYGSVHIAAWESYFPSTVEKWLWHSSSIFVAFSGAVWVLINLVASLFPAIDALWIRFLRRETHWITSSVIILLCTLCGISYVFSRAYLVIESFNSLRKLPKAVYDTPSWIQVLPHL